MASLSASPIHTSLSSSSSSSFSTIKSSLPPKIPKTIPSTIHHLTFPLSKTLIPNSKPFKIAAAPSTLAVEANSSSDSLKYRLKNGETLYGIFLLTFSPTLAEIAGLAGYDFAVVDMEHGHGGISDALPCLSALAATSTAAILRLPESSAAWAKKALDLGPQGIMFPMIDGPKSARKAVSYCLFPPKGVRGSAHPIVRASGYGINEGYLSNYEDELLIMCQVECEDGVKKIEEIVALDGVDCIQMGPLDLSASMGYLWDPGNKKVKEVLRGAEKAVLKAGKSYLSGFVMPHDGADQLQRRGYHMVAGAADVGLFRSAAVEDVKKFKKAVHLAKQKHDDEKEKEDHEEKKYRSE